MASFEKDRVVTREFGCDERWSVGLLISDLVCRLVPYLARDGVHTL